MAGQHGKNAELRVSTGETRFDDIAFVPHPDATLAAAGVFVPTSGEKDWKYASPGEADEASITYISAAAPSVVEGLDGNSRFLHYAGGAVLIPPADFPVLAGSVSGSYTHLEMETVGNLRGDDRSWELNVEADIVDTTVLRENFQTFVEGIPAWSGSIDGLYNNPRTYKLAIANASGHHPAEDHALPAAPGPDDLLPGDGHLPDAQHVGRVRRRDREDDRVHRDRPARSDRGRPALVPGRPGLRRLASQQHLAAAGARPRRSVASRLPGVPPVGTTT